MTQSEPEVNRSPHQSEEQTFLDLGVSRAIVDALKDQNIVHPFPIQALTLPVALKHHDIIGQAKTGTGKTLGFGIPMLEDVLGPDEPGWDDLPSRAQGKPQGLVLEPTRELADQVAHELTLAASRRRVRIAQFSGGHSYDPQLSSLNRGVEIVVGTPGRILDLIARNALDLSCIRVAVLDEADEMLDLGFLDDVNEIFSHLPSQRQTMLFSATMPTAVVALARTYMQHPTHIRVDDHSGQETVTTMKHLAYLTHPLNKEEVLARILQARGRGLTIIFTHTKRTAGTLASGLRHRGFAVGALHGDLSQGVRERALRAFRHGKIDVLVATDVAARGIDVENVTHVVNYETPKDEKEYIHRVGRTGRAGAAGIAITFVAWDELVRWLMIDRHLNLGIGRPEETYHTSAKLLTDLDIPEDAQGTLPRSAQIREGLSAEKIHHERPSRVHRSRKQSAGKGHRTHVSRAQGQRSTGRGTEDASGASRTRSADSTQNTSRRRQRRRRHV
ncbi:MAG: DEAD/DEAH box helicase [Actinomycetaceae bacterium]|nr:DEAD/DEAH box helicase [Actinomycetaceae bacterium]MDY6082389.1 DEAD/DEAH box helicase [Actinomycetaceae bacterium]